MGTRCVHRVWGPDEGDALSPLLHTALHGQWSWKDATHGPVGSRDAPPSNASFPNLTLKACHQSTVFLSVVLSFKK